MILRSTGGARLNAIAEGWARPPIAIQWHYFAGICGMGGRFRSLCDRERIRAYADLHDTPKGPACAECAEKLRVANENSMRGRREDF